MKKTCKFCEKLIPLHRVFHSIRFKVNKGWSTAVLLFFCLTQICHQHQAGKTALSCIRMLGQAICHVYLANETNYMSIR